MAKATMILHFDNHYPKVKEIRTEKSYGHAEVELEGPLVPLATRQGQRKPCPALREGCISNWYLPPPEAA